MITNMGLKGVRDVNVDLKDPNGDFEFNSNMGHVQSLPSLNYTFFQIPFWSKNCSQIYAKISDKNLSYGDAHTECKKVQDAINLGQRNLIVKIRCPACFENEESRCYELPINLCNYSSDINSCNSNKEFVNLVQTSCPDPWY